MPRLRRWEALRQEDLLRLLWDRPRGKNGLLELHEQSRARIRRGLYRSARLLEVRAGLDSHLVEAKVRGQGNVLVLAWGDFAYLARGTPLR